MDVVSNLRSAREVIGSGRSVGFRPATPRDDRYLRDLVDSHGSTLLMPIDIREMLSDIRFREQRQRLAAAHPAAVCEILVLDGVDVGRLVLERDLDVLHVVDVTVHRDHRRRGIASAALRQVIDAAHAVSVRVARHDQPMVSLCRQLGFAAVSDAHDDSRDADNAVTMLRDPVSV